MLERKFEGIRRGEEKEKKVGQLCSLYFHNSRVTIVVRDYRSIIEAGCDNHEAVIR